MPIILHTNAFIHVHNILGVQKIACLLPFSIKYLLIKYPATRRQTIAFFLVSLLCETDSCEKMHHLSIFTIASKLTQLWCISPYLSRLCFLCELYLNLVIGDIFTSLSPLATYVFLKFNTFVLNNMKYFISAIFKFIDVC